ncbi:MAG: M20/M25/M40 family metallo-hydrolase, partial [Anaerolineae bacterium]
IGTLLFYSYGLGLYGQIDPLLVLILTVVILVIQIRLSEWWFTRYRFGPMEWLWRTLTYRQIQPLRQKPRHERGRGALRRRIGQVAGRVNARAALTVAWIGLLLWASGLGIWYWRLETRAAQIQAAIPQVAARTTAGPAGSQATENAPQAQPTALATPAVQPVAYDPGPLAASGDLWALASAFDAGAALDQIKTLSGAAYQGRYPTTAGSRAAGDYIAEQFARYGLQPAGDEGSFFQPFPFEYIGLASTPRLVVEGPEGAVYDAYEFHQDYSTFVRWYAGAGTADGEVVWANNCTADDLDGVDTPGKIVFCRSGEVREAQRLALEHGAEGLLLLIDAEARQPDFGTTFFEPWVPEPFPVYWVYPTVADELLLGSAMSVEDLSVTFTPFPLETSARMEVETVGQEACAVAGCQARNVLGVLPGRDPAYADQVIILGAHYDHLGQAPNGIVWPGANDDASGVAVLLELARTWHEQGYVPRHTVLFAAWDAEEEGLLGAVHYVENPRYPLDETLAMIQLDMVGAGGDTLWIDGGGQWAERLHRLATSLDLEAEVTHVGRSDHVPFQQTGVPAALFIWDFLTVEAEYHRPLDKPETIDPEKLDAVGQITSLAVLGLSEGEPAIEDLLARRAASVAQGDLDAFLATSLPGQEAADRFWFADAQALAPEGVEMQAENIRVLGREATARIHMTVQPAGDESEPLTASLDARFVHDGQAWRWAGPDLVWLDAETGTGFAVAYPAERQAPEGVGAFAAEQAGEAAATLGLPRPTGARLLLFPNGGALRASTALSLPPGREAWVGPGLVKLTYGQQITASRALTEALVHLVLAEAGVTEGAAPWLWRGLPLALRGRVDPVATQMEMLPELGRLPDDEAAPLEDASAWAAVEYLRQEAGWQGIGQLVTRLGQACQEGLCESGEGLDQALAASLGTDAAGFQAAWQGHWQGRLGAAQAALDALLEKRAEAALAGDETAFLETVDASVPNLLAEEGDWLADLAQYAPEGLSLRGQPLALLEEGGMLARVTLAYRLGQAPSAGGSAATASGGEAQVTLIVRLTPGEEGYRWAGTPFDSLQRGTVRVLYPAGRGALAESVAAEAGSAYSRLATDLGLENQQGLTFKLYEDDAAFRASISLAMPAGGGRAAWRGEGESIKLRVASDATVDELRPALATLLTRRLLTERGVDSEWLLKGVSLYLAGYVDGGASAQAAAGYLHKALAAEAKGELPDLATMPPDQALTSEQLGLVQAKAWDTIRYLVYAYGEGALQDLLAKQAQGQAVDTALQNSIGQRLAAFEAAWAASAARGHADPAWIEIANAFDPERVEAHIEALARPELAGRQAGSPGAEAAAAYIADEFARVGLLPAGDLPEGSAGEGGSSFFQSLPITYTTLLAAPRLAIVDERGQTLDALIYREDFILPPDAAGSGDPVRGELIWVQDGDLAGMDLAGKVVVLEAPGVAAAQAAQVAEQGAAALLVAGDEESAKVLLAKAPLSTDPSSAPPIPVLALTAAGLERLLQVAGYAQPRDLGSLPAVPLALRAEIEVPLGAPQGVETANVLGLLPGSDPTLKNEIIILGAHYDHVGDDPEGLLCTAAPAGGSGQAAGTTCETVAGRRFAGANDDASGVGVLLEMARLWSETGYRPKRSILFAAWGAQELGELGSSYYVEHPAFPLAQTSAMLQLDAVGGGGGYYLEAQGGGSP